MLFRSNRIATDAICDYWFTTEESGNRILKESGFPEKHIFFVGNTMIDSLHFALPKAEQSTVLQELDLKKGAYGLVTMHRPSNVDDPVQLQSLLEILAKISSERAIVFPMHPRTSTKIREYGFADIIRSGKQLVITHPKGYIDFLALMKDADFVLTDSGGIKKKIGRAHV